ncbi:class I SAM-dependent methyltransferase [Dokdonella ginsengisoli]|uniref:Class I SAM-dependent methyltransferase n=1 Tax=Dokdonella ginsengisoli TaxID=363846 RepID=A0ABV9QPJ5_9GAMM
MAATNYKTFWDDKASTTTGAFIAVDGSANEDVARLTGAYTARQVACALDLQPGDRVLELGCGVGRIGRELAPKVAHWEGADISANMLGVARERLADFTNVGLTELKRTRLETLPSASFSKAYCVAVFIHMDKEDFFLYLEELARVLEPGGLVFFDTWNLASDIGWRRFALEVDQHRNADPSHRKDVARNQFSTPEEVRTFAQRAGFEPLATFSDSPWVQAVAIKTGGRRDAVAERARVERDASRIAYTPLWNELFDAMVRVSGGGLQPQAMLEALGDDARGEEVAMFRVWFRELWRHNEAHWGPLPAGLA